jgi:hypothetical protein
MESRCKHDELERRGCTTENRGVPGSRPGLATPVDETRPLSCGVTLASQVRQKVRQKIGQNRSRASERRTSSPGSRDKRPANAHQLPRDEARPTGFEPVTFGSVDRGSTTPRVHRGGDPAPAHAASVGTASAPGARGMSGSGSRLAPCAGTRPAARCIARRGSRRSGSRGRHGRPDGEWKDCVLVERLLGEAAA